MMDINKILETLDSLDHSQVEEFLNDQIAQAKREKNFGIEISLLNELIGFCRDTCQHEKNTQNAKNLLQLLEEQNLIGTQAYATSLLNIANAYRAAGRLQESLSYYKEVYHLYEKQLQPGDFLFASLNNNMALLYQEMQDYENACACLEKALTIAEKDKNAYIETATTHTNLAQSLLRLNKMDDAMKHLDQALTIFAEDGNRDYHYSAALSVYGEAKYMLGEYEASAKYYDMAMQEFEKHMGHGGNYELLRENRDAALIKASEEGQQNAAPETDERKIVPIGENDDQKSTKPQNGLSICESFYYAYGQPMIHEKFPEYENQIAVGLAGEGSDCFGFDDEISRDHDWGPGFCMWLTDDVYHKIGSQLQEAYEQLPKQYLGYLRYTTGEGAGRTGVCTIQVFYQKFLGKNFLLDDLEKNQIPWDRISEESLATVTNGCIFVDPEGTFTKIRNVLLSYYPEEIRRKYLGRELLLMAKTGQYNYARMIQRKDNVTAQIYLGQFMEHTLHTLFLLNKVYAPYTKWLLTGAANLNILPEITDILRAITDMPIGDEKIPMTIEIIAQLIIEELNHQGLTQKLSKGEDENFLEPYGRNLLG